MVQGKGYNHVNRPGPENSGAQGETKAPGPFTTTTTNNNSNSNKLLFMKITSTHKYFH